MTMGLKRKGARITTHVLQKTEMNSRIGRPGDILFTTWSKADLLESGVTFSLLLLGNHCEPSITGRLNKQKLFLRVSWGLRRSLSKLSNISLKFNMNEELRSSSTKNKKINKRHIFLNKRWNKDRYFLQRKKQMKENVSFSIESPGTETNWGLVVKAVKPN